MKSEQCVSEAFGAGHFSDQNVLPLQPGLNGFKPAIPPRDQKRTPARPPKDNSRLPIENNNVEGDITNAEPTQQQLNAIKKYKVLFTFLIIHLNQLFTNLYI